MFCTIGTTNRLVGLFVFGCFTHHAQGQACDHTLRGRVLDDHDGSPLAFAEVRVLGTDQGVVADVDGGFRLHGLCAGAVRLRVSHLGCADVERTVVVPREQVVIVELEHHAHELRELEVVRQRPDERVGQSQGTVEMDPATSGGAADLGQLLTTISGLSTLSSGPTIGKPTIQGLSGNRIVILNQGVRQEDQQWGAEHAPSLDPFSTDRITVVKGAASVQYGSDAIGGVVITRPVELPREGPISGAIRSGYSSNGRGGSGGGHLQGTTPWIRGLGWRIQGNARRFGDAEAARYVLSNTGLRELSGSVALGYQDHRWSAGLYYSQFRREVGILRAAHIGNLTDLQNAINSGKPWYVGDFTYSIEAPRQEVLHHLGKVEAGYAVTDRDRVVLTYAYQVDTRREYDVRRSGRSAKPALDLGLATHSAEAVLKHWLGTRVHGRAGFSGTYQENINTAGTGVRPLIPNYRRQNLGVFWIEHMPLSQHVEVEAGLRYEVSRLDVARYDAIGHLVTPIHRFANRAFSGGAVWSLTDSVRLRGNVGAAYRPPHVSELYSEGLHHGAAAIEEGNASLRSERSLNATLDLEGDLLNGRLHVEIGARADRIADFIYLRPDGISLTVRGAFPVFTYVSTDARLFSYDALVRMELTARWTLKAQFSTTRARDILLDEWLFQMPADRSLLSLNYTIPAHRAWEAWEFTCDNTLVMEQRRVPVGVDLAEAPKGYGLVGASVAGGRTWAGKALRFGVQGNNLLDLGYRDHMDRFRYFADARGRDVRIWLSYAWGLPKKAAQ